MKVLYKRFLTIVSLLGATLVVLQIFLGLLSPILSLDKMVSSTASSLLASTNNEVKENLDQHFKRMIRVGNQVSSDDNFISYSRSNKNLTKRDIVEKELMLGKQLAGYTALDNFCDCCVVFSDGSYLGQIDAYTLENFPDKSLYDTFSNLSERDSQNFLTSNHQDFSRIYYSKAVNPTTVVLVSILREDLSPVFYSAEENFNLTLHFSTPENYVVYSGNENEMVSGVLEEDLAQSIMTSNHLSTELRGHIISSDTCINGWRVTSTIPTSALAVDEKGTKIIYFVVSIIITITSIVLILLMSLSAKKRIGALENIEENLEEYTDIDDINLN